MAEVKHKMQLGKRIIDNYHRVSRGVRHEYTFILTTILSVLVTFESEGTSLYEGGDTRTLKNIGKEGSESYFHKIRNALAHSDEYNVIYKSNGYQEIESIFIDGDNYELHDLQNILSYLEGRIDKWLEKNNYDKQLRRGQ